MRFSRIALLIVLLSVGCSATIPVFVVRPSSWDGSLHDESGKKVHEFRVCKPTSAKEPCLVVFFDDLRKLEEENAAQKKRIAELERNCKPQ